MALVKISELPVLSTATSATLLAAVEGGVTKKLTLADLSTYIVGNVATGFQEKDSDLTAIADVSGNSGILKKTSATTWALDTTTYLSTTVAESLYQPVDPDLTSIAGLSGTTGLLKKTATNTWELDTSEYLTSIPTEVANQITDLQATGSPTGFSDRISSTLSFNNTNRTFTIVATSTSYKIYLNAVGYTKTTDAIQLNNTNGLHYVYFDSTDQALKSTTTLSDTIFKTHAIVSIIYWNVTLQKAIYVADERHGIQMDGQTHLYLHLTQGAQYRSGLGLNNITLGAGTLDSHATFSVSDGVIADEDLTFAITNNAPQQLSTIAQLPVFYRLGSAVWGSTAATDYALVLPSSTTQTSGFTRPAYNLNTNGTWSLSEVASGSYVLMHIFATNDINTPVIAVLGGTYTTLYNAKLNSSNDIGDLSTLPIAEYVKLGVVIYQTSSSYTNTAKSRIVAFDGTSKYIDTRVVSSYTMSSTLDPFKTDGERDPQLTYNGSDQLIRIDYASSNYKTLTYSGSNLSQVDYVRNTGTFRKTLTYASGKLASISYSIL